MKTIIDINNWSRKEHFHFFSSLDDPFFGVTVNIDFTTIYQASKEDHASFFLYSLHYILQCVNETEAFRLRIEGKDVVKFDTVHVSSTIAREDGTFGFAFFEYTTDRSLFIAQAIPEMERVKNSSGLSMDHNSGREDVIHFSSVPWFAFTEMKHAASFGKGNSIPRISTGKLTKENGSYLLPVNICVHHGLMDGRHLAEFIERLSIVILNN